MTRDSFYDMKARIEAVDAGRARPNPQCAHEFERHHSDCRFHGWVRCPKPSANGSAFCWWHGAKLGRYT